MENICEDSIVIFNEVSLVRQRIKNLLQEFNVSIYEAYNEASLYNLLYNNNMNVTLLIMDIGYDTEKGFDIITKIKEKKPDIVIDIMTSNNHREAFNRGVESGASDYILIPFEDDYVLGKMLSAINRRRNEKQLEIEPRREIVFDIHNYLSSELKKAKKAKYDVTLLMCSITSSEDEDKVKIDSKKRVINDLFYNKFLSDLWETDIFVPYEAQSFVGIFPYCSANNISLIITKMMDCFNSIKRENNGTESFEMNIESLIGPIENMSSQSMLTSLYSKMQQEIEERNKENVGNTNVEELKEMEEPELLMAVNS